ncbi:MAG TPA: tetratricopeptide repeat protein [Thermoanaerobaculia bacterium]|nr:tetratricopeptide repeat protein [Thermoanaerobaculia bacterium]
MRALRAAGTAAIALLCAWALWQWCVVPLRIDLAKPVLKQKTETVVRARNSAGAVPLARETAARIEILLAEDPYDIDLLLLLATNLEAAGRIEDAMAVVQRALAVEPRPELHFAASMLYLQLGNLPAAIDSAEVAVRFKPVLVLQLSGELRNEVRRRLGMSPTKG